jgi:2-oxoglutarate ferredoxin oxidoreductase subunit beta
MHTIRYNPCIVNVVHNNQVFGLTKGQASPTSQLGFVTDVQVHGVYNEPFNGPAVAIALGASFVARAFIGDVEQSKEIYRKALANKGYALIDLFCPCVTFNKVNTYQWFKEHTYYIDESHDPYDREKAFALATAKDPVPLGVLYLNPNKPTYEENVQIYQKDPTPLFQREVNKEKLGELIETFR